MSFPSPTEARATIAEHRDQLAASYAECLRQTVLAIIASDGAGWVSWDGFCVMHAARVVSRQDGGAGSMKAAWGLATSAVCAELAEAGWVSGMSGDVIYWNWPEAPA
jgi:hypothetical protein